MIKIDKNIPMPKRRGGRKEKYPLDAMKVGESFFVPKKTTTQISASLAGRAKALKFKLSTRSENGGCRVWRVK